MTSAIRHKLGTTAGGLPGAFDHLWNNESALFLPPAGATTEIGRRLWAKPRPLIHPDARMIVVFSPRSACTAVVIWFLTHLGHAKAAKDFHIWPHHYREWIYYFSQIYRDAYALDLRQFRLVRVVRDPCERAVSSFRHALAWGYADGAIAVRLRRLNVDRRGLAFAEFLDLLERTNLATCNDHYRFQRHPIEDVLPVHHLINVSTEDLFVRLNEVEAALGLPQLALADMQWLKQHHLHNRPKEVLEDATDIYTRRLSRQAALHGPWPASGALLTEEARQRIARLYAIDYATYMPQP